jgi:hypothetical protein
MLFFFIPSDAATTNVSSVKSVPTNKFFKNEFPLKYGAIDALKNKCLNFTKKIIKSALYSTY